MAHARNARLLAKSLMLACVCSCILGQKKQGRHVSALIAAALTMFYYLYLYLSRMTLDVFNCSQTEPPDGAPYGYMEAVFEECFKPGGMHMTLFPVACATLLVYTIGFPAFVFRVLWRGRALAKQDQLLRAQKLGSTRAENPACYDFRKRFNRLYYNFKPSYYYWILVILARKAGIAFTSLMFKRNPAFQVRSNTLVDE